METDLTFVFGGLSLDVLGHDDPIVSIGTTQTVRAKVWPEGAGEADLSFRINRLDERGAIIESNVADQGPTINGIRDLVYARSITSHDQIVVEGTLNGNPVVDIIEVRWLHGELALASIEATIDEEYDRRLNVKIQLVDEAGSEATPVGGINLTLEVIDGPHKGLVQTLTPGLHGVGTFRLDGLDVGEKFVIRVTSTGRALAKLQKSEWVVPGVVLGALDEFSRLKTTRLTSTGAYTNLIHPYYLHIDGGLEKLPPNGDPYVTYRVVSGPNVGLAEMHRWTGSFFLTNPDGIYGRDIVRVSAEGSGLESTFYVDWLTVQDIVPGSNHVAFLPVPGANVGTVSVHLPSVSTRTHLIFDPLIPPAESPQAPHGFRIGDPPRYFTLTLVENATFPWVDVCIDVSGYSPEERRAMELLHYVNGAWERSLNGTTIDPVTGFVCGRFSSLSPFVLAVGDRAVNTPPAAMVALNTAHPRRTGRLVASVTAEDADGDAVSYRFVWKKNGRVLAGQTGSTLDLRRAGRFVQGDVITVEVTPNDGATDGNPVRARAVVEGDVVSRQVTIRAADVIRTYQEADQRILFRATISRRGVRAGGRVVFVVRDAEGGAIGRPATSPRVTRATTGALFVLPGGTPPGTYEIVAFYRLGKKSVGFAKAGTLTVLDAP